jgi:hypothetical protein
MRNLPFIFPLLFGLLLLTSCNQKNEQQKSAVGNIHDSIKVGMTYDEVQHFLGRPSNIIRGANHLVPEDESFSQEELKLIKLAIDTLHDTRIWAFKKKVQTIGQLLYVTWTYPESIIDTNFTLFPKFKMLKQETAIYNYFINGIKTDQTEFEAIQDTVYFTGDIRQVSTKKEWEKQKSIYPQWAYGPYKAIKHKKFDHIEHNSHSVFDGYEKHYFVTRKLFCVIFDASSGRATDSGFMPFEVQDISKVLR